MVTVSSISRLNDRLRQVVLIITENYRYGLKNAPHHVHLVIIGQLRIRLGFMLASVLICGITTANTSKA